MIFSVILYLWLFYGFFLIYCTLRRAKVSKRLDAAPRVVRWVAYSYLWPGVGMDWLFHVTLGALIFWEWPWLHGPLFTQRCSFYMNEDSWRGELARWICLFLNTFDDNHCH